MILRHSPTTTTQIAVITLSTLIIAVAATSEMYLTCHRPSSMSKTSLRSPKYLRMQEKVARNVPCDLANAGGYCNLPGDHYPWHSVRRFVSENQGLIRRMYGEVRQLSVLRMEIQDDIMSNSIEQEESNNSNNNAPRSNEAIEIVAMSGAAGSSVSQDEVDVVDVEATTTSDGTQDEEVPTTTTSSADAAIGAVEEEVPPSQQQQVEVATETTLQDVPQQLTTETNSASASSPAATTTTTTTEAAAPFEDVVDAAEYGGGDALRRNSVSAASANAAPPPSFQFSEDSPSLPQQPTKQQQLKAVNACPVKEEVVAPYWANNTRGEILALLNLYPFEQYIHYEKCNNEFKQMFCRDGCRCEQQYRLHRLLAFDPTNECRGIFSDWFRFPSCCVCKCYLNEEQLASHYRSDISIPAAASSRSPRKIQQQHEFQQDNLFHDDDNDDDEDDEFMEEFDFYEDKPDVDGVAVPQTPTNSFFYNHHGNSNFQMPRRRR